MSEIKPALTADDWRAVDKVAGWFIPDLDAVTALDPDDAWKAIALANHALPSSDPRKITRADVDAMDEAVESMRRRLMHEGYGFANGEALLGVVRLLSQKLAALLPPDA